MQCGKVSVSGRTLLSRIAIYSVLGLFLSLFPAVRLGASDGPYHLAVRTSGGGGAFQSLKTEDFKLAIDDVEKTLLSVRKKQKSLALAPDLGREFILSFNILKYGAAVERELSYLVSEVLQTSDVLFLLTPLQLYRLNVTVSKGSVQRKIRELLEKDGKAFRDEKKSVEAGLKSSLNGLIRALEQNPPDNVEIYRMANNFLNSFPEEFSRYRQRFLLPDPARYDQVLEQIGFGEGERWCIHFEQSQDSDLYEDIQRMIRGVSDHISLLGSFADSLGAAMRKGLAQLEKDLSLPDVFPSRELVGVMTARDVSFNVVFVRGDSLKEANVIQSPALNMTKLYSDAAFASGGAAVSAGAETAEIATIVKHIDVYYDLAFLWEGPGEQARIRVLAGGSPDGLRYADTLTRPQYAAQAKLFSLEKIRIDDISVADGKLSFGVKAFQRAKEGGFGLVKIKVALLNAWNQSLFQEENTMRATKDAISISIPLPGNIKGASRISITACDLIANRSTVVENPVAF